MSSVARILVASLAAASGLSCAAQGTSTAPGFSAPVGIGANRRYFVDGDGKPCLWSGDTQWELLRAFREEEARAVLEDRQKKGFNAIQVMLLGVGGGKEANVAGHKPYLNDDVSTPNEDYFSAADAIVKQAERLNQILVVGVYHKAPEAGTLITVKNARSWGAWVGRRYRGAPNIIWSMFPVANASYVPVVRELAAGLAEGDGGRHLITVHPDPSPASSSWIHEKSWLSFNTLQSWKSDFLNYRMVAADYARTPIKPVVNGEARYEEEGGTTPLRISGIKGWDGEWEGVREEREGRGWGGFRRGSPSRLVAARPGAPRRARRAAPGTKPDLRRPGRGPYAVSRSS